MNSEEGLEKVHIDLPNHWATNGEAMWARPLGGDEYEIQNLPFYAYGLNYLDVVEAIAAGPDRKPSVVRLVRPSGHRTLRVFFDESTAEPERVPLLETMSVLGTSIERATERLFAVDVRPDGDYSAVRTQLDAWVAEGLLDYETCEARIEGSFDDAPSDETSDPP
jgi:hypothetical protein